MASRPRSSCLAVGLMSGTSMDGIDACLVKLEEGGEAENEEIPSIHLLGFLTRSYPPSLRPALLTLPGEGTVAQLSAYHVLLGRLFAEAALAVVADSNRTMNEVAVIGSHGQTILHQPFPQTLHGHSLTSTLQLGDPSVIAQTCGVTTVGDFRVADMAAGGQGAPLVPYLDSVLLQAHLRSTGRVALLLNIGGIANISAHVPGDNPRTIAFDTGPGNVLMDSIVRKWFGKECDMNGEIASSGRVSVELLGRIQKKDNFLTTLPPKSTGREHYSEVFVDWIVEAALELKLKREDVIATVTDFTAVAVWCSYQKFIEPELTRAGILKGGVSLDLFVSGGGAKNPVLMSCLTEKFTGFLVSTTADIGIDPDAKEAICFALLAYQTCRQRPTNLPSVTGAQRRVILGKVCPVSRTEISQPSECFAVTSDS